MNMLAAYVYGGHICEISKEARRGYQIPLELELQNIHEPLCGCWELNLCLLEEKPVFLTTEISLLLSPFNTCGT